MAFMLGGSPRNLDHLRPRTLRHTVERGAELVVTVAQEKTRSIAVHGCIPQLLCCPLLLGITGGGNVDNSSRRKVDDEECAHLAEEDVVGLDKVARPDVLRMILQERRLGLSTSPAANPAHVLLDRALVDLDAELEQLSLDALGSPETASAGHVANEVDGFLRQRRSSSRPRSESPEQPDRCQRSKVSGCTMAMARRNVGSKEEPRRSFSLSVTRDWDASCLDGGC
jgi:hypothetical protein